MELLPDLVGTASYALSGALFYQMVGKKRFPLHLV